MRYFIEETNDHEQHAGTKARQDVCDILTSLGWQPLKVRKRYGGNTIDKFKAIPDVYFDWKKISKTVSSGDVVLVQYPINTYPKVAPFALPALHKMKSKGARIIMIIHDLERLRTDSDVSESKFFSLADVIICHNDAMKDMLQKSYPSTKFVSLGIFDYLTDAQPVSIQERDGIDIAGNLNPEKSTYVYSLAKQFPDADFHLYGPNFKTDSPEARWYEGSFAPELLPSILHGRFGLVWDGDSTTTCSGAHGEYLKVNNPHKLSLYLASNMPVIIWDQAAEAAFVTRHHIGITASGIADAIEQVNALSPDDYTAIAQSAARIGEQLRSGHFLQTSIDNAMKLF